MLGLNFETDVEVYKEGFEKDLLDRSSKGDQLSEVLARVSSPMVIAVDGNWGSGKSFFLKCWVKHHLDLHPKSHVVYYDAFGYDYLSDPLLTLSSTVADRLDLGEEAASKGEKFRKAAGKLLLPVLRVGLAAGSAGLTELAAPIIDGAIKQTEKEVSAQISDLWKQEAERKIAYEGFKSTLEDIATEERKLIIVIDELDRCRPDFALSLLEVTKHFFNVPNVHFVLGANLSELANMVRARYGADTDGQHYLRKFISVSMTLTSPEGDESGHGEDVVRYFEAKAKALNRTDELADYVLEYIKSEPVRAKLTLRQVERILQQMQLVDGDPETGFESLSEAATYLLSGMIILKVMYPDCYMSFLNRTSGKRDVEQKIVQNLQAIVNSESAKAHPANTVWSVAMGGGTRGATPIFLQNERNMATRLPRRLALQYLETFSPVLD